MRRTLLLLFVLIIKSVSTAQSSQPATFQTVEVPSGSLRLKAYLWKPPGPGPFPAVLFNHGRSNDPQQHTNTPTITDAAKVMGPVFVRHGYVFLYLFRRGEGLSADQGEFIGDLLQREEATKGRDARNHLQVVLLKTDHLDECARGFVVLENASFS